MKKFACMFILFFIPLLYVFPSNAGNPDVVIVCNKKIQEDSLTSEEIRNIFLGNVTQWKDGTRISVAVLEANGVHESFLKKYVNKNPVQFRNWWTSMVFNGRVPRRPKSLNNMEELIQYIKQTEGTIGYASYGIVNENVKILTVN